MLALKPCPFCGGVPQYHAEKNIFGEMECKIVCTKCGTETQTFNNILSMMSLWNNRITDYGFWARDTKESGSLWFCSVCGTPSKTANHTTCPRCNSKMLSRYNYKHLVARGWGVEVGLYEDEER